MAVSVERLRFKGIDGKAKHMRLRSWGWAVLLSVVALVLSGCVTGGDHSKAASGAGSSDGTNKFCSWILDKGPSGKVREIVLIKNLDGACKVERSADKLFIGDAPNNVKEVLESGEFEFVTKGSCRRCYLNSFGGMTCLVYPGC